MKTLIKILAVFAAILLLSAVLAPAIYPFLPFKFARIFNRLVMISTIAAAFFYVRSRRDVFPTYRYLLAPQPAAWFLVPFFSGAIILFLLAYGQVFLGAAAWAPNPNASAWLAKAPLALGTGLLVGFIEELFFRGWVFHSLKNSFKGRIFWALVVTALFYSVVHFLGNKRPFIGSHPTFFDSLRLIAAPFVAFADFGAIWKGVVGLFLFGWVLNCLVLTTRSLYPSIGLHAGAVFFIKIDGLLFNVTNPGNLLTGSSKMYDGILGWFFLGVLGLALDGVFRFFWCAKKKT